MATRKTLEALLVEIAQNTNQATSEAQAIEMGKDRYLQLEYASVYGGYRVVNVKVVNGGHSGAFGGNGCEARLSAKKMEINLRGVLEGTKAIALNS
jgi:hypothetical protein